jgi:hypothetical protein
MPITVKFAITQYAQDPQVDIQITGDSLHEIKILAEKFVQDYAVLNGYPPHKLHIFIVNDSRYLVDLKSQKVRN